MTTRSCAEDHKSSWLLTRVSRVCQYRRVCVQCKHVCQSAIITRHGGVHGIVAAVARRMNEVTLRRAWLVLGWVTIFGRVYHAAASGPKFTMLWERVEAILLLNKIFFSDCRYVPQLQRYRPTKLCDDAHMAIFWGLFASCICSERRADVSDLHLKFALRPHHLCAYGRHPICDGWD